MYQILREEIIPERMLHIIWDVNGTITIGDVPDREILEKIVTLAIKGIQHSFITGRDRRWLEKMIISPLNKIDGFEKAVENLHFYPELGLMKLEPISGKVEVTELIKDHPITNSSVRKNLASLVYQTKNLSPYYGKEKSGYFIGGDVDGNFYQIPRKPEVELPWFIWEDGKELMAAFGIIRDLSTFPQKTCAEEVGMAVERLKKVLKDWRLEKAIKPSPVSTAINLVPIISGMPLDKNMAAGIALYNLAQRLQMNIHEVCSQTIAVGDSSADLLFATPILGLIPLFFVGPRSQLKPTVLQEKQIALLAEGAIEEGKEIGPKVTREVLQFIESKIPPKRDAIYFQGEDDLEEFKGDERLKRGIDRRIRHSVPEEDVHIHDAILDPSLQEGHTHSDGYEAIMLQNGDIDALVWTDKKIQTYPLRKRGDMIIFLPNCKHTLIVKQRSRIIVSKAHTVAFSKDRRQKVDLPINMEALRQDMLEGTKSVKQVLRKAKTKYKGVW